MPKHLARHPRPLLEQIIDSALDAFIVIGKDSRVIAWTRQAQVLFVPALAGAGGFAGLGAGRLWAEGQLARPLAVGDLNGDGRTDVAAADFAGVRIIYGEPPALVPNTQPQAARDLGTAVHLALPAQAILPGQEDAYLTLKVPEESVAAP